MTVSARPGVRIAAFAVGLAAVFGVAFGIGVAVGPWDEAPAPSHGTTVQHGADMEGMHE